MMVVINGKKVSLDNKSMLGSGGEAAVFLNNGKAVKIYHTPTPARAQKLQDFMRLNAKLPDTVIYPQDLVYDSTGTKIIGFTMKVLDSGQEVLASLSNKKFRNTFNISTKDVVQIFLNAYTSLEAIHNSGIVVGDLNELNELFIHHKVSFIDVDSFQFGNHPCMVATEAFIDPRLYGIDLTTKPMFKPENDWYSFAVLLFKSLLLVHPYGGIHNTINQLTQRANQHITVFHKDVQYPKIGLDPEIVSDDLLKVFAQIFENGWRGKFPLKELQNYGDSLIKCKSCNSWYPNARKACPACNEKNAAAITRKQSIQGITAEDLLVTCGKIVYFKVVGQTVYCVADENGMTVLYIKGFGPAVTKKELFQTMVGAKYEIFGNYLVVAPKYHEGNLKIIDFNNKPVEVTQTVTDTFGNKRAVFACSTDNFYRIVAGTLMKGSMVNGNLIEKPIMTTMEHQTWFTVSPDDVIFGFHRIFKALEFFLVHGNLRLPVNLPQLDDGESMLDIDVKFSDTTLVVFRKTKKNGSNYIHVDMIDTSNGKVYSSYSEVMTDLHINTNGAAYGGGFVLYPTANGIVKEHIVSRQQVTMVTTEPFVDQTDSLVKYLQGLMVITENKVVYLTMK